MRRAPSKGRGGVGRRRREWEREKEREREGEGDGQKVAEEERKEKEPYWRNVRSGISRGEVSVDLRGGRLREGKGVDGGTEREKRGIQR